MRYSYQAEKLSAARHALMLPHSRGEAESIADAFHEISLGLHQLDVSKLSQSAQRWIATLQRYMAQLASATPTATEPGLSKPVPSQPMIRSRYRAQ